MAPCDAPEVTVLLVDDQAPFRAAARAVLARTPGFLLSAEAESGEDAVALAAERQPSLVLMDINLPGISGIEATRRIVGGAGHPVVVLLSTYERDDLPADALDAGAVAYVHKEELGPGLLRQLWADHGT